MSTQSQIDANRANAQNSSGPVTPEGREASSHNRGTHFLSQGAEFRVLPNESERDFHILFMEILTQFNPRNSQEMFLIKRMSEYEWMRRRAVRLQDDVIADTSYMRSKQFALFLRYESQNFRAYNTCREQLLKLRSEQIKSQIGSERKSQREQQLEWQKQRAVSAEKARQVDIECKIVRTLHTAANNPEALQAAREVKTRHQAA